VSLLNEYNTRTVIRPPHTRETCTDTDTFDPIKLLAECVYGAQKARSIIHFNNGIPTGK